MGPFLVHSKCPGCKEWFAIVLRVAVSARVRVEVVGIEPCLGRDLGGLRRTLLQFPRLTADERELILTVASLLGYEQPADSGAQDPVTRFLAQECACGPQASVAVGELFGSYRAWCARHRLEAGTLKGFGKALRGRGFTQRRGVERRWVGLGFLPQPSGGSSEKSSRIVETVER